MTGTIATGSVRTPRVVPAHPAGGPRRLVSAVLGRRAVIVVFAVALATRLGVIFRAGGVHGIIGYDCGVYFAGADALVHGRMPYRDFTMVHPPGITLTLTPFAYLTRWMTDWHAFIVATVAFCLLGATNAVLVVGLGRRLGLSSAGACVAGLFYAVWFGSVIGEFEVKLEPLGNLCLLVGLLLLLRAQRRMTWRSDLVAGIGLGLTLDVKIWWAVPVLLLACWHAWRRHSVRAGLRVLLGTTVSVAAVCLPFFIVAPSAMFRSVVLDQLGRNAFAPTGERISELTTVPYLARHIPHTVMFETALPFAALALMVLFTAWGASSGVRALLTVVIVQFGVLMVAPSWFGYYSDYLAVGLALCVGAAASSAVGMRLPRLRLAAPVALTVAMAVIAALITITGSRAIRPYTGAAALTRDVRHVPCLISDNPTVLLRLNALTRGIERGCPEWIDVTGTAYGIGNQRLPRTSNIPWQRLYAKYLRSGDALVPWHLVLNRATRQAVERDGELARVGGIVVYRVVHDRAANSKK